MLTFHKIPQEYYGKEVSYDKKFGFYTIPKLSEESKRKLSSMLREVLRDAQDIQR